MTDHDPLVDLLDRALDDVGPVAVDGLADRLDTRRIRRRRRRRVNRLVPIGAAAALLVVLVTVLVRNQPATQVTTDDGTEADGSGAVGFEPGWHRLDTGPLGPSSVGTTAWTGRELVALFTTDPDPVPQPDGLAGAALDPATGTWRRIAPVPLPAGTLESVWTGSELIVVRASTPSTARLPDAAAAWDATSDTWRLLPPPPPVVASGLAGTAWSGREALFPSRLGRFDPATSRWSSLPPLPPDSSGRFFSGWTGSQLLLARTSGVSRMLSWAPADDAWVDRPPPPEQMTIGAVAIGDRMILVRGTFDGAGGTAYDARSQQWSLLPPFDAPEQLCDTTVVELAGTVAVQWCSTIAVLADDHWIDIGEPAVAVQPGTVPGVPGSLATLIGGGDVLFAYGDGREGVDRSFDLFVPDADQVPGSAAPVPPTAPAGDRARVEPAWSSLRIGGATLDVPGGYAVAPGTGEGDAVTLELPVEPGWAPERPCTIRSRRASDDPAASLGSLHERSSQPDVDHVNTQFGRPTGAFLAAGDLDADEHVIVSVSDDEVIDIACQRLLTARELAQYLR